MAVAAPVPAKQFFDTVKRDNEITIITTNAAEMRARKATDNLAAFIDLLNSDLAFVKIPVVFTKTVVDNVVTKVSFTHTPKPGYKLEIDSVLSRILGYSRQEFGAGTFVHDRVIDETYFKSLENGFAGDLTEFEEVRTHTDVAQLADKPDLEVLFGYIKKALDDSLHRVTFIVDTKKSTVKYTVASVAKRILLSSFLNEYLGLTSTFSFHESGMIRVPRHILFPSNVKPPPTGCSKLLVLCDAIKPQVFAGKELPVLAVLDRKHTDAVTNVAFEPTSLVYKPTQVAKADHISITLQSDQNDYIGFQDNPTVINLHFLRNGR